MVLYLITELYPLHAGDSTITHAIKDFTATWEEEVIVFRPIQLSLTHFRKMLTELRILRNTSREDLPHHTVVFALFKIPLTRKYLYRISKKRFASPPDVVMGHSIMGNYMARSVSRRFGVPFTAALHNYDLFRLQNRKKEYLGLLDKAGAVVCRSNSIWQRFHEMTHGRYLRSSFIANSGVEEQQIRSLDFFLEKARKNKSRPARFITVSRLWKFKNIHLCIEILSELEEDFTYTIIGDGPDTEWLREIAVKKGVSAKVRFTGWKDRQFVMEQLEEADVFMMVSSPETFGLAYLEAMAKGCVVLGAYGWGIDGIVRNGENGFLAEPGDKASLRKAVAQILSLDSDRKEQLLRSSYETVSKLTAREAGQSYLRKVKDLARGDSPGKDPGQGPGYGMPRTLNRNEIRYLLDHLEIHFRGFDPEPYLRSEKPGIEIPASEKPLDENMISSIEGIPVLFPVSDTDRWYSVEGKSIVFHHDILKSAFYLLSGYQEYVGGEKDSYGRFPWEASVQKQLGITRRPVVNYYFEILLEALEEFCRLNSMPFQRTASHSPVLFLSHDVDRIRKYSLRNVAYYLLLRLRILPSSLSREERKKQFRDHAAGTFLFKKDPYRNFRELTTLENSLQIRSTWFMLENTGRDNSRYRFRDKKITGLIRWLEEQGHEIAIHGTMESSEDAEVAQSGLDRLNRVCRHKVKGSRQHFLKYLHPQTTNILSTCGLLYDASLGFAGQPGFRNSYAFPFRLYDFEKQKAFAIWHLPLNVMDASLMDYMKLSPSESSAVIGEILKEVRKFRGVFGLLWHQCRLDEEEIPGIDAFYNDLLRTIRDKGFISKTGSELTDGLSAANALA